MRERGRRPAADELAAAGVPFRMIVPCWMGASAGQGSGQNQVVFAVK